MQKILRISKPLQWKHGCWKSLGTWEPSSRKRWCANSKSHLFGNESDSCGLSILLIPQFWYRHIIHIDILLSSCSLQRYYYYVYSLSIHMYCLLYQNTPTCHLDQEHSFTTHEFRARAFCIVSLNFLRLLFFCRCFLSLSHHISRFAWTEGSPGTRFLFKTMSAVFLNIFHHIVCWYQSGSGMWFQWLMTQPAKMLASKQSSHYLCTMWCSGFYRSFFMVHMVCSLFSLWLILVRGRQNWLCHFFWCWPCKYPCQICFMWFGRTYHRQFKHVFSWESLILGR